MKFVQAIFISLFFVACGIKPEVKVEAEFVELVEEFEAEAQLYNEGFEITNLTVKFGEQSNEAHLAHCSQSGDMSGDWRNQDNRENVVYIDRDAWEKFKADGNIYGAYQVIYHELGHCVLNRGHLDEIDEMGVPVSLMGTYAISPYFLEKYWAEYKRELFSNI